MLEGEVDEGEKGLDHTFAAHRDRFEHGLLVLGAHLRHCVGGGAVAEILLVPLDDVRQRLDGEPVHLEIFHHVHPVLVVLLPLRRLAVGDEGDGVRALEHDPARRVVHHLARDGEELELHLEIPGAEDEWKRIKEKGAVVRCVERHQVPAQAGHDALVERAQIRRLPGQSGTVVDDLERQLSLGRVELHLDQPFVSRNRTVRFQEELPAV
ncbi:MAG: hypothetical protein E6J61_16255 [Deltaproteobacteria bacterium]|nr:MAG: hypothetical protein E6J61_16255 [Deltaproteobacteria bacterium]